MGQQGEMDDADLMPPPPAVRPPTMSGDATTTVRPVGPPPPLGAGVGVAATLAPWLRDARGMGGPLAAGGLFAGRGIGAGPPTASSGATTSFEFDRRADDAGTFVEPTKQITTEGDVATFLASSSCRDLEAFLKFLCDKVVGVKVSDVTDRSPTVESLVRIIRTLSGYADEIPPAAHTLRYGNPAYRDWHQRMSDGADALVASLLPEAMRAAAIELVPYLQDSFGNRIRIDYGTGHETNFLLFIYCLAKQGLLTADDARALVLVVFKAYLDLMRKIQLRYGLEPAGSRGCWGLDDYQILPFIFGSAQLIGHPVVKPKSIHNPDFVEAMGDDYLYFSCVRFVLEFKKGPIAETSPMLNDISAVGRWAKVHSGMLKMYHGEVLSKFPIVQHMRFGTLFPWVAGG